MLLENMRFFVRFVFFDYLFIKFLRCLCIDALALKIGYFGRIEDIQDSTDVDTVASTGR